MPWFRRECAAWSHAYRCGEMRVGEVAAPVGLWTPIISVPSVFHGDVGGTSEMYGPAWGMESLSGSPSSVMIWRRSVCVRRGGLAGEDGWGRRCAGACGGGVSCLRFLFWGVRAVWRPRAGL